MSVVEGVGESLNCMISLQLTNGHCIAYFEKKKHKQKYPKKLYGLQNTQDIQFYLHLTFIIKMLRYFRKNKKRINSELSNWLPKTKKSINGSF